MLHSNGYPPVAQGVVGHDSSSEEEEEVFSLKQLGELQAREALLNVLFEANNENFVTW